MNRRDFLKAIAAVPVAGALPAVAAAPTVPAVIFKNRLFWSDGGMTVQYTAPLRHGDWELRPWKIWCVDEAGSVTLA